MSKEFLDKYRIECEEDFGKYYIDPEWLLKQINRPDGKERIIAFYESVHEAISTDDECWLNKGCDFVNALLSNNATQLLIGLCGWGPETLARRVFMKRGQAQFKPEEMHCRLMVDWSDDVRQSAPCIIRHENHEVYDFDYGIFIREDAPEASIQNVFVRFMPFEDSNEYDFQCVSQAERDATKDEEIFWYAAEK